jgi:hypothetical protein
VPHCRLAPFTASTESQQLSRMSLSKTGSDQRFWSLLSMLGHVGQVGTRRAAPPESGLLMSHNEAMSCTDDDDVRAEVRHR